jgi:hypothetical protein
MRKKVYAQKPKSPDHNKKSCPKNKQRKKFQNNPKTPVLGQRLRVEEYKTNKTSVLRQPSQGRISSKIMISSVCRARKWKRKERPSRYVRNSRNIKTVERIPVAISP